MSQLYSLEICIKIATEMVEDQNRKLFSAENHAEFVAIKEVVAFMSATKHHLEIYQSLLKDSTIS